MTALTINLQSIKLTDEQFFQLCQDNRDLKFERNANKEYRDNGVRLGWLINGKSRQVENKEDYAIIARFSVGGCHSSLL